MYPHQVSNRSVIKGSVHKSTSTGALTQRDERHRGHYKGRLLHLQQKNIITDVTERYEKSFVCVLSFVKCSDRRRYEFRSEEFSGKQEAKESAARRAVLFLGKRYSILYSACNNRPCDAKRKKMGALDSCFGLVSPHQQSILQLLSLASRVYKGRVSGLGRGNEASKHPYPASAYTCNNRPCDAKRKKRL